MNRCCAFALRAVGCLGCMVSACVGQPREARGLLHHDPPVFLNHLLVTVDSATYAAVGSSAFLRDTLAAFEQRTTFREGGRSYTATYLYGRQTYFELFQNDAMRALGRSGLALGVDRAGEIAVARGRLLALVGGDTSRVPLNVNTRRQQDRPAVGAVPWYFSTAVFPPTRSVTEAPQRTLSMWVMEFHRDFLELWAPGNPIAKVTPGYPVSRAAVRTSEYRTDRLLDDVVQATFALEPYDGAEILSQLAALGYMITRKGAGRAEAVGPAVTIRVEPSYADYRGLVALAFTLNRPRPPEVYRFGARSRLVIKGRGAHWTI